MEKGEQCRGHERTGKWRTRDMGVQTRRWGSKPKGVDPSCKEIGTQTREVRVQDGAYGCRGEGEYGSR